MFSHVTLGTNDWARARPFWIAVMASSTSMAAIARTVFCGTNPTEQ